MMRRLRRHHLDPLRQQARLLEVASPGMSRESLEGGRDRSVDETEYSVVSLFEKRVCSWEAEGREIQRRSTGWRS